MWQILVALLFFTPATTPLSLADSDSDIEIIVSEATKMAKDPALKVAANSQWRSMAKDRLAPDSPLNQYLATRDALKKRQAYLEALEKRKKSTIRKIEDIGLTQATGFLLQNERLGLNDNKNLATERQQLKGTIANTQIQLVHCDEERQRLLNSQNPPNELAQQILTARVRDYSLLFRSQVDLDSLDKQIIDSNADYLDYINERIYWIPNTRPLSTIEWASLKEAIVFFIDPDGWLPVVKNFRHYLPEIVIWPALVLALLLSYIFTLRKRLMSLWQKSITNLDEQLKSDKQRHKKWRKAIYQALLAMSLRALAKPLIMVIMAIACHSFGNDAPFFEAISKGFLASALVLYLFALLQFLMAGHGLDLFCTSWTAEEWQKGHYHAAWVKHTVSILTFICCSLQNQPSAMLQNGLGRICFILLLLTILIWLLIMARILFKIRQNGWRRFVHRLVIIMVMAIAPTLISLTIAGYYQTAISLGLKALLQIATIIMLIGICRILYNLVEQKAKLAEALVSNGVPLRHFVQMCCGIVGLGSVVIIWKDVLPAFKFINSITLWTIKVNDSNQAITLGNALMALILVALTITLTRNLSTLLSIAHFDRLPFDAGVRNALATTIRYIIILCGVGKSLTLLGVSWSDIQWLVAAVSVGLGFGLQEIFANFVSGIIILFERPVRPGDTVTIGDVSGVITKINIRATTILDWDNREMIVPNKEFITGRILNWTGSDKIQRAVISVGVAYGSDTKLVQETLLKIAQESPFVLKTPAPSILFSDFADSSLNFDLRVYVDIDNLTKAKHTLRLAINEAFTEAGIEIPFPQRDVHLVK